MAPSPRACEGLGMVRLERAESFYGAQPPSMRWSWHGSLGTRRVILRLPAPELARVLAWFAWNAPSRVTAPSPRACDGLGMVRLERAESFYGAQPPSMRGSWPGSLGTRRVGLRRPAPEHARDLAWFAWNTPSRFTAPSPQACEGLGMVRMERPESFYGAQPPSMRGTWNGSLGTHRVVLRRPAPEHARVLAWFAWNAPSRVTAPSPRACEGLGMVRSKRAESFYGAQPPSMRGSWHGLHGTRRVVLRRPAPEHARDLAWFARNAPSRFTVHSPRACEGLGMVCMERAESFYGAQPPSMRGTWHGSLGTRRVILRRPAPEHARVLAWFA